MGKSSATPLSIAGKRCNLPSFIKLSSDSHAKKLDHIMQTTCAYNSTRTERPFISLLIVPTKEDIDELHEQVEDADKYEHVREIATALYTDIKLTDSVYNPIKEFGTINEAMAKEALYASVFPGGLKEGEFTATINGNPVKCKLTGIAVFKISPTQNSKSSLGGFIACAQESMLNGGSVKGGRVVVSDEHSSFTSLSTNCEDNSLKLSAILSIHNTLHNAGGKTRNGIVNNALLCYSNSIWMRSHLDDNVGFNKAIAFRDTHPFVDLVMHFTPYSPFILAGAEPVCCADYLEVDEHEIYQKLNELTAAAISKDFKETDESKNVNVTEKLKIAITIREKLRNAWSGSNGDVSKLITSIPTFFNDPPPSAKSAKVALNELHNADNCCEHLFVSGGDGSVVKDRCITAEEICAFIGK